METLFRKKKLAHAFPLGMAAAIIIIAGNAQGETELNEITVTTTTKTEVLLRDAPASTTVITRQELEQRPIKDVIEAVRESTGISLVGRGVGGRKVISIRGMESHQSLILIDGKRVTPTDNVLGHSDFQFSMVPIEAIERIEIVRGPLSALYGSEALGGVVNIITRDIPEQWGSNLNLKMGFGDSDFGGDENGVGLYTSGPLGDKAGLTLSISSTDLDKTADRKNSRVSEIEGKDIQSIFAKFSVAPIEGHKIELDTSIVDEGRDRDAISRDGVAHVSSYALDRSTISLAHKGQYANANSEIKVYKSEFEQVNSTTAGVRPTTPQKLNDEVIDGHFTFGAGDKHLLTVGGEHRTEGLEHKAIEGGEKELDHDALFVQDEIELSADLLLTLGVREDDHELFGNETSPRAYLVYHANDAVTVKGGFGHGFKAPTIKQVSPEYQFRGFHSFIGNEDVGPETSDNYEIGVALDGGKTRLGLTAFSNDIEDLIDTKCIVNCSERFGRVFTYVNVDKARTQGVETEINIDLSDSFGININHVYLDAEDRTSGLQLASRPRHSANARFNWHSESLGVNAALRVEYIGSQVEYDRGRVIDLPAYSLLHVNLNKRINNMFTIRGGVENIGDISLAEESGNFGYAERGRFVSIGLNATF